MIRASIADKSDQTKVFAAARNEGGTDDKGQLAGRRHLDRLRRDKVGVAAAVGDRIDQRGFRGAILAENIAGEILDLRAATSHAACLPGAGEAILTAQHAVDLLRVEAGELQR